MVQNKSQQIAHQWQRWQAWGKVWTEGVHTSTVVEQGSRGAGPEWDSGGDGDDENRHEPHEAPDIAGVPLRYVQQSPCIHKYTQRDVGACACVKHNLVCVVFF